LDPLAKRLGCSPIVKPELIEAPALFHESDRAKIYPQLVRAEERGDWDEVARLDASMDGRWTRHGLRASQITSSFPYVRLDESFVDDEPWCR
jgi:hypothetical protein